MGVAFEITEEDVAAVLDGMGLPADGAADLLARLDDAAVEAAALHGDAMEQQTAYAHEEILRQLGEMGVAPSAPSR